MRREVVITGVGAITALGNDARSFIDGWIDGQCAIEDGVAACSQFDPRAYLSKHEVRRTDRYTQLAVAASDEAVAQAGWTADGPYVSERIGCVTGTGVGGLATTEVQTERRLSSGPDRVSPFTIPCLMPNAASAAIAMRHGLHGPSFAIASACASGAHAIGTSVRLIQSGEIDAAVTGGIEAALTPLAHASFRNMGALSRIGVSRPFDARRDGFILAEGAGVLVLEEAEAAAARGATILGRVLGYAATVDAHHLTAPEPTGRACARAITLALADAGLEAGDVDYVNAHGTSTILNDRSETEALKLALGPAAGRVPISSAKSAIGHTLGAAGALEAIATVLALRRGVAPPTLGYGESDPGLDLDYVPERARPLPERNGRGRVGLSNSFGFGGHNAVLCLAA